MAPSADHDLDSLFASADAPRASTATPRAPPVNSDVMDLDLDDLLGPPGGAAPPQRFSGGGTSGGSGSRGGGGGGDGWGEQRAPPRQQSYGGSADYGGGDSYYAEEFGTARGKFGQDPDAAHQKAVKGDRLVTNVEVSDDAACPVADKDIDPKTIAALKARGIENFTPVQVSTLRVSLFECCRA